MREFENGRDVEGCGDGLVAVAVEAVVDVSGAGHEVVVGAAVVVAGTNVAVVTKYAVLGTEAVLVWVVNELALAAVACALVAQACVVVRVVARAVEIKCSPERETTTIPRIHTGRKGFQPHTHKCGFPVWR